MDGVKKSGAGLSYRHEIKKNLAVEVAADVWRDITTDYSVRGGLTWRW